MAKIDDLTKEIESLSLIEVSELVKALEKKFGISATPTFIGAMPGTGGGPEAATPTEKEEYLVTLTSAGENKINVIKALREINPELGLKEAKDLVDKVPSEIGQGIPTTRANEMKAKLEEVGATVELK